ncbi:hypothetical protein DFS34DRAFT_652433 [Phlyctochytrium arcticum]|nr:hypothetical protein DFS34DRAFT_652433 [Phlyctochytrium arcticum]
MVKKTSITVASTLVAAALMANAQTPPPSGSLALALSSTLPNTHFTHQTSPKSKATMVKTSITAASTLVAALTAVPTTAQTPPPSGSLAFSLSSTLPKACTDSLATNALALFGPCSLTTALSVLTCMAGSADAYIKAIDALLQDPKFLTGLCSQECTRAMTTFSETSSPACGTAPILSLKLKGSSPPPNPTTDILAALLAAANTLGLADLVNTVKSAQTVACAKTDDNTFCLPIRWAAFRAAYPDLDLTKVVVSDKVGGTPGIDFCRT